MPVDGINDSIVVETADCNGANPYTVNVLLGNGNGTYQPEQAVYSGDNLSEAIALRGNRDTKADFVLTLPSPSNTYNIPGDIFENTTSGNFPSCSAPNSYTGITMCSPTSTVVGGSPVAFKIGAANQTQARKVEVWIDGKKMSEQLKDAFSYDSFLDASYSLAAGKHNVTVFSAGWDNLLESISFPLMVGSSTCTQPSAAGLNVCSPINNATLGGSGLAWASGTVTGTIARMEVWVDGVKKYSTYGSNTLKSNVSLAAGTHRFDYYIVNTAGAKWEKTVYAYVPSKVFVVSWAATLGRGLFYCAGELLKVRTRMGGAARREFPCLAKEARHGAPSIPASPFGASRGRVRSNRARYASGARARPTSDAVRASNARGLRAIHDARDRPVGCCVRASGWPRGVHGRRERRGADSGRCPQREAAASL